MSLKELQKELIDIISEMIIESDNEQVNTAQKRALEIISELKNHINDKIKMNNMRITILDLIIFCDSHNDKRLNNRSLLLLEDAVKNIGGKSSQELEGTTISEGKDAIGTRKDYILLMSFCFSFSLGLSLTCIAFSTVSVENSLTYGLIAGAGIGAILAIASIAKLVHYASSTNLENANTRQPHIQEHTTLSRAR